MKTLEEIKQVLTPYKSFLVEKFNTNSLKENYKYFDPLNPPKKGGLQSLSVVRVWRIGITMLWNTYQEKIPELIEKMETIVNEQKG